MSLLAVGVLLATAAARAGRPSGWYARLGAISVVLSWAVVHTVFAGRYARLGVG